MQSLDCSLLMDKYAQHCATLYDFIKKQEEMVKKEEERLGKEAAELVTKHKHLNLEDQKNDKIRYEFMMESRPLGKYVLELRKKINETINMTMLFADLPTFGEFMRDCQLVCSGGPAFRRRGSTGESYSKRITGATSRDT